MKPLNHVEQKIQADINARSKPTNYTAAMQAWHTYLTEGTFTDKQVEILAEIRSDFTQREILEALLLSNCPSEEIEKYLKIPVQTCEWYKELFFDTNVFLTELSRIVYIETYADNRPKKETSSYEWAKELKLRAVNLGYEYVLYSYANVIPDSVKQQELIERMFMASSYKAMNSNYYGINSDVTKNAVKHAELMLKAHDALQKIREGNADVGQDLVAIVTSSNKIKAHVLPKNAEII